MLVTEYEGNIIGTPIVGFAESPNYYCEWLDLKRNSAEFKIFRFFVASCGLSTPEAGVIVRCRVKYVYAYVLVTIK